MHQILAYWDLFVDKVKPHHEVITALSTGIIAVLTIVLAYVAWRQVRDARVLQRAYVAVTFNGIKTNSAGQLVGHVIFKNAGHMPAQKFCWRVHLDGSGSGWKPPKIKIMEGVSVIPVGSEWPMRTDPFDHPQEEQRGLFLYVWGRATYNDGFSWRKRRTDFCHRYPWEMRETPTGGGVSISAEHGTYHESGNRAT
jgi:hypothetical protein